MKSVFHHFDFDFQLHSLLQLRWRIISVAKSLNQVFDPNAGCPAGWPAKDCSARGVSGPARVCEIGAPPI